jgi:hypothetical protein
VTNNFYYFRVTSFSLSLPLFREQQTAHLSMPLNFYVLCCAIRSSTPLCECRASSHTYYPLANLFIQILFIAFRDRAAPHIYRIYSGVNIMEQKYPMLSIITSLCYFYSNGKNVHKKAISMTGEENDRRAVKHKKMLGKNLRCCFMNFKLMFSSISAQ